MKSLIEKLIHTGIEALKQQQQLANDLAVNVKVERTREKSHGDFACNVALLLAKPCRKKPREIAEQIVERLDSHPSVEKIEIAGPGFINFHLKPSAYYPVVEEILNQGKGYGRNTLGAGQRIQIEFVSANPTGPLHVGHGRGAAYGATLANLLTACGYDVQREYYVNDAGRQMDILAVSVWLRYLELCGEEIPFPSNGYKGDYVWDIAANLHRAHGDALHQTMERIFDSVTADEPQGGDKEKHIDDLVQQAKTLLGAEQYRVVFDEGLTSILENIRLDLKEFGVEYDQWFSERALTESGAIEKSIQQLSERQLTYQENGALWFRSTDYGDEKDRVVVRENGQNTYFAADIAYHANKIERGFDRVIDIWGADHHGYVPRVRAAMQALGNSDDKLEVLLVQFAILYRSGVKIQMSTRSGEFVTLKELRQEVGNDAARFFYVMRKCEQHLDFDLDLAKSQSNDNPVYYIQYAHARVCSVFRQLQEKNLAHDVAQGIQQLSLLTQPQETDLLVNLSRYSEALESAAIHHEPHQLAHYLRELSNDFHTYYNAHPFIVDEPHLRDARLTLISAVRQVVHNGLQLLGVSAPESM